MAVLQLEQIEFLNQYESYDVLSEGLFTSPIKKYLKKLKEIKDNRPDDEKELYKFIDKYYDDLEKAADKLSNENKAMKRDEIIHYIIITGLFVASIPMFIYSMGGAIASTIICLIYEIIATIALNVRKSNNKEALSNLIRIKVSLKNITDGKNIKEEYKTKLRKAINKIEDCENYFSDSIKTTIN